MLKKFFLLLGILFALSSSSIKGFSQEEVLDGNNKYPLQYTINNTKFAFEPTIQFEAKGEWQFGREPTLRRMPDGSLGALVYSGGPTEPSPDNLVLFVRSTDDGKTWSEQEKIFDHSCRAVYGTELFTEGPVPFVFIQTYCYESFFAEFRSFISYTHDSGKTWEKPISVPGTPPNFCVRQGRVLSDGSWIFPIYWVEQTGKVFNFTKQGSIEVGPCVSAVIRSTDQGKTFSVHGYITNQEHQDFWEPEIIELSTPGHLLMLVRVDASGHYWKSESQDYGLTWSPAVQTDLGYGGAKITMYRVGEKIVLFGNFAPHDRKQLLAYVSNDDGQSWQRKIIIADSRESGLKICYPHGFVDEENKVIYLSCDSVRFHYFLKIPFDALD